MENELLEKILTKIEKLDANLEQLNGKVDNLEQLNGKVDNLDEFVKGILTVKLVNLEVYIKENVATKNELSQLDDKLTIHIDGFIKLHETLDLELVALRGKYDRLEERV